MPVPKCLFFQDLEDLTEVFGGTSAGMSGPKLPLWAEFSFLILGALGEFQRILGATLGIQKLMLGMQKKSILGMAPQDLSNTKTTILGASPGAILGIDGEPTRKIFICLGIAKGSSVSWVAKFKGEKNSECKLSNGRSRSYKVIKLLLSARK